MPDAPEKWPDAPPITVLVKRQNGLVLPVNHEALFAHCCGGMCGVLESRWDDFRPVFEIHDVRVEEVPQ